MTSLPTTPPPADSHPFSLALLLRQRRNQIFLALFAVYVIWGSTYLGMHYGLATFPPFMMNSLRFALAGGGLMAYLLLRGEKMPPMRLILNAMLVGMMTLAAGTTSVAIAEQWVSTGIASLAVAAVPLWVAIFSGLFWRAPSRREWVGLLIGFSGIVLLNLEGGLQASPEGALALIVGPVCWSLGSIISRKIVLPTGMMAIAWEMIGAFLVLFVMMLITGEQMKEVRASAILAVLYLATFGSLIGFTAYMFLLSTVRPALATSYAYVNPIVAVFLGVVLAGETITTLGIVAMVIILSGVAMVVLSKS